MSTDQQDSKLCLECHIIKPRSVFQRTKKFPDGRSPRCRKCAYSDTNGASRKRVIRKLRPGITWQTPEGLRRQRSAWLLRKYGITVEEYEEFLAKQGGACAICATSSGGKSKLGNAKLLAVDHDHATGKVRGLLCTTCNQAVGGFKDDISLLERAIEYLKTGGGR